MSNPNDNNNGAPPKQGAEQPIPPCRCGGKGTIETVSNTGGSTLFVRCVKCAAAGPWASSRVSAIERWIVIFGLQATVDDPPVGLAAMLEKARASQRVAELDLRAALSAAKDSGPLWLLLYEQVEAVSKAAVRMETITRRAAPQEEREAELIEAAKELVAVCHFSPCDGSQIASRDKLEAVLAQKGGGK